MKTWLVVFCLFFLLFLEIPVLFATSAEDNILGKIEWQYRCHPLIFNTGLIRVIDPDMNIDAKKPDRLDIEILSDYDLIDRKHVQPIHTLIENENSTGIFESIVFWGDPHDEGLGHRVPIWDNVTVTAKYADYTLPSSYLESKMDITSSIIIKDVSPVEKKKLDGSSVFYYVYEPCTMELLDMKNNLSNSESYEFIFPPPLPQIKSGLLPHEVICKDGLLPTLRADTESVICLKSITHMKLIERSWEFTGIGIPDVYNIKDNHIE